MSMSVSDLEKEQKQNTNFLLIKQKKSIQETPSG